MSEGTTTGGKRKISIGFIHPQELEGDTIYVKLKKIEQSVHAEAISKVLFNCPDYSIGDGNYSFQSDNVSNFVGSLAGYYDIDYKVFLGGLERENNAEISTERCLEDGLELSRLFGECLEIRIG
mgnify:CR=1 FL=1